jgi:lysophospholipase L1-like esterase
MQKKFSQKSNNLRRLIAALALAATSTSVTFGSQTPTASPLPFELQGTKKIACLGDSITQIGDGPGGYVWLFRHYLADLYPQQSFEVINAGISGNKSTDMVARFQTDVLDKKPDLLTISVGVNDVWHGYYDNHPLGDGPRGVKLEDYRKNVDEMIRRAQSSGIRVVILSATLIHEDLKDPMNIKAEKYNATLRDLARDYHLTFVDYQKAFRALVTSYRSTTGGRDNLLTVDGVHMNAQGNKVMAHTLLTALGVSPEAQASVDAQIAKEEKG